MPMVSNRSFSYTLNSSENDLIFTHILFVTDLNPSSYKYLLKNIQANHVERHLHPYNMDGRDFIIDLVTNKGILPHETIMNLPQTATDFLDVFIGLRARYEAFLTNQKEMNETEKEAKRNAFYVPRINVYAFSTHPTDPIGDIRERCAGVMQCSAEDIANSGFCEGHVVRDVSPKKVMICLSFYVPLVVANATPLTSFGSYNSSSSASKKRSAEDMLQAEHSV